MSPAVFRDPGDALLEAALDAGQRRRHGQHFTKPDPADLLIALSVRDAGASVLDPACGSGALLRRVACRLRFLSARDGARALTRPGRDDARLLGYEIDPLLAREARRKIPGARIVQADFLDAGAAPRRASGLREPGAGGLVDAVVGNPPYVRQELIDPKIKMMDPGDGPVLSRRSDLHARFWHPALERLRPGGRLGFIASGTWLDAEYGAALRDWLGVHHRLVAVIESQAESWFDRARVRTVIVIVQRQPPDASRPARFATLRVPLATLVPPDLPESDRLERFDRIATAIERGEAPGACEVARPTPARSASCAGGAGRPRPAPLDGAVAARTVASDALSGRTWGPLLRLPDFYFELMARLAARMVPLGQVATVRWGIKTGDDAVFCPARGPVGTVPPVEENFLAPLIFRLAELDRLMVTEEQLGRWVLLVDWRCHGRADASGVRDDGRPDYAPRLAAWIERAERERASHLRPTCAARAGKGRAWYELRPGPPGMILWSIMHQYRHLAPLNPEGFPVNDNLLQIDPKAGVSARLLAAILNSHVVALVKHAHGRQRNEGMLKTQAGDVRRMPIPDPRRLDGASAAALCEAFDALGRRRIGPVAAECDRLDRRGLDCLVLEAFGWSRDEARMTVERLGACLKTLHAGERRWEIDAIRRRASR